MTTIRQVTALCGAAFLGLATVAEPAAARSRDLVRGAKSWRYQLQGDASGMISSNVDVVAVDLDHARGFIPNFASRQLGN